MITNYKLGQSKVNVLQLDERGQSKIIQRGIVVGERDNWLRIFDLDVINKGGDASIYFSQWFCKNSPRSKVELIGELKETLKIPLDL